MPLRIRLPLGPLALAVALLWPSLVSAQVNTAGLRGSVKAADDGTRLELVEVTLIHRPSGNRKTTYTNESGEFAFTGLRVGGPYSVEVFMDGFLPQGANDIFLTAGKKENVSFSLPIAGEVIQITGTDTATTSSDRRVFGQKTIQELPSMGRDPKDLARLSPDAVIDDSNSDAISIGGANNRFNSVTIDGIRQDDDFGLNAAGYPTSRSPVSLAAIEQIAVESSPFDVRYGKFLGGNINIVTKSGTNEFHGSLFTAYTDESFTGAKTGEERRNGDFRETRYGFALGGPIIKDKVHFFVNMEGLNATTPTDVGVAGSGSAIEVVDVSAEDLARVQDISRRVYNFEAGQPDCDFVTDQACTTRSLREDDLKALLKLDWSITDRHRLSAKYQRTAGNSVRARRSDDDTLSLTSSWYDANDTLNSFALQLFSDWTDNWSTEVELSGKIVDNRQVPLNGTDFAQLTIETPQGGEIVLGPDVFRHNNRLDNNVIHSKAQTNYLLKSHLFTAGYEFDLFSVDNLFVQSSRGDVDYASIEDFEARRPSRFVYNNSVTNNAQDARADWGYGSHALYLQDQYDITPNLTVQAGVRGELFTTNSQVVRNDTFADNYGFANNSTIDGKSLLMPRFGVSWRAIPRLNLRAGAGLYGGGTPNVWLSNSYTNDGQRTDSVDIKDPAIINGFNAREIPAGVRSALRAGNGNVDALDPNFQVPSTWKASAGADYTFDIPGLGAIGRDLEVKLNYVYSQVNRGIGWEDLRRNSDLFPNNTPIGTLPDGRPYYDQANFNSERGYDLLLTNQNRGFSHSGNVSLSKSFDFGLSLFGAYSLQRAKELNPANSSTSSGNYGRVATADPQNLDLATSNYERAHRLISVVQFSRPLIGDITGSDSPLFKDLKTSLALFWESRSGQPFSYTYGGRRDGLASLFGEDRNFAQRNRMLFYVPTGNGDDVALDGIDQGEFDAFLRKSGLDKYRGQIAPRNAFRSPWFHKLDMRFSQDLPSPISGHKGKFMLDIENVGNLVNSNWGRFEQVGFPYVAPIVDVDVDANGKYVYSSLRKEDDLVRVNVPASVWRIQMTLMYEF